MLIAAKLRKESKGGQRINSMYLTRNNETKLSIQKSKRSNLGATNNNADISPKPKGSIISIK